MFTIQGADGKTYGPVPADKVQAWIMGGRANLQTKARREGETEWKTLGDFAEFAAAAPGGAATAAPPVVPPLAATPAAAIPPATPAVPVPMTGDASNIAADLIGRTAKIDVFDCVTRSFELWKSNFWSLVGVTLLVFVVQMVAGMIPLLGILARLLLNGVFAGGLYYFYLGKLRGEPREVGDAFAGFTKAFVPLMFASLMTTMLVLLVMLPFSAPLVFFLIKAALHQHPSLPVFTPFLFLSCFVGCLIVIYLSVSWTYTFLLVIDRQLGPWTAMEVSRRVIGRQWFRVFFVLLLGAILTLLGVIGLLIGVIFTLPLMIGAVVCAYEAMCNPPAARAADLSGPPLT
jgi:uncharacterized membrane protein